MGMQPRVWCRNNRHQSRGRRDTAPLLAARRGLPQHALQFTVSQKMFKIYFCFPNEPPRIPQVDGFTAAFAVELQIWFLWRRAFLKYMIRLLPQWPWHAFHPRRAVPEVLPCQHGGLAMLGAKIMGPNRFPKLVTHPALRSLRCNLDDLVNTRMASRSPSSPAEKWMPPEAALIFANACLHALWCRRELV